MPATETRQKNTYFLTKKIPAYEYVPNKRDSYKAVKRTLAQLNINIQPSRMWTELAFGHCTDHQMQPLTEWMPGCTIDLLNMDELCGLRHIPIGSEMIYQEPNTNLARPRPRLDRRATVERLHDLGVLDNVERPYLLKLKDIFDEQVKIATAESEKLQIYISRWSALSKCLDYVANPHNPYGPR
jgi:hypothetical protein